MSNEAFTEADLQALAGKMVDFVGRLTPREQALFGAILWRAADDPEQDVYGHHPMVDPAVLHMSMHAVHHLLHLIALKGIHAPGGVTVPVKLP